MKWFHHIASLLSLASLLLCSSMAFAQNPPKAPSAHAPKTSAPKTNTPKSNPPKTSAPKSNATKTSAPKTDAAKVSSKGKRAGSRVLLSHAPPSVAAADEPLSLRAVIDRPERLRRAIVLFRPHAKERYREVPFQRASPGPYEAIIPVSALASPQLEYAIELLHRDGRRTAAFASRKRPHVVQLQQDGMEIIEQRLAERLDNRRSIFTARGEYVSFGTSRVSIITSDETIEREVRDQFYRVELGFEYRTLGVVAAFGIRGGVVRGTAPVSRVEPLPGQTEQERFDVGLNYGAPWVRFRAHDYFHIDGSALANITEEGFSVGTGSIVHIGDMYGSKLSLGFEWIDVFGARFFSKLDIQAHHRVRISPLVEVTNMPNAERYGVRLIGEVGVDIGAGFAATAHGGYQARESTSGGPSAGGTVSYAF